MAFNTGTILGRTKLEVGRLGIASSVGADTASYEEACERGCKYCTWGTFSKGRSGQMRDAIRNIKNKGKREELIVAMLTYAHNAFLTEKFFIRGLKVLPLAFISHKPNSFLE